MLSYQQLKNIITNEVNSVKSSEGWIIPFDPSNTDYQAYLAWLAEGNTPEPAENT